MNLASVLVRRRKSTDIKTNKTKPRSNSSAAVAPPQDSLSKPSILSSKLTNSPTNELRSLPSSTKNSPSVAYANPSPALLGSSAGTPKPPDGKSAEPRHKFSTADRTILEELRRNITARSEQFVIKGPNGIEKDSMQWGAQGIGTGKRHHPFGKSEVPYPKNYEREVLDLYAIFVTTSARRRC